MKNKTRDDAIARVLRARMGSLAEGSSEAYLIELRDQLLGWASRIEGELKVMWAREVEEADPMEKRRRAKP
jgi:hypothetical protein